jgi:outer membrane protein insertion porin family
MNKAFLKIGIVVGCQALVAMLIGLAAPLSGQDESRVSQVLFMGNHAFSSRTLAEPMLIRAPSAWKRVLLGQSADFSEPLLQQDLKSLVEFYQREGFIDVLVSRELRHNLKDHTVAVVIRINENQPVLLNRIDHLFVDDTSSHTYLDKVFRQERGKLKLSKGQRFRDEAIQQDKAALTNTLANNGYLYAQVAVKIHWHEAEHSADLVFEIRPGPLCRFGSVKVSGNHRTDSSLIVKQVAFKPYDLYSQEVLQRSQRFIYQLGVFQYVTIKVSASDSHKQVLPVELLVREAPRVTTKLGVGYGREEYLRFFVDLNFLNLLGGARRLNLYAKHSKLEPYHVLLKLTQPAFIHPGASLSLYPFYRSEKEPGYAIVRYGADFSYQQRLSYYTDGSVSYTFERDRLSVSRMTAEEALKNQDIKLYNKSSVTFGLVDDRSYPIFQPQRGWYNAASLTLTGVGLQSDFHYLRWIYESRKYTQLLSGYVFAARVKLGAMKPLYADKVTPLEERFYSGGSNSVRGWGRSLLGPISSAGRPMGGNSLAEASVEMRLPLYKLLHSVVFCDLGNVWSSYLNFPLSELHYAAGAGLRFQTPIGPIRLDVAWPLGEGGNPVQVHASIGQAF